jgi:pimeloyl-ACP methyl ester carboxylesterase
MTTDFTLDTEHANAAGPICEYDVRGGDGILLHAREWGNPQGSPILFVHGWSQCDLCWSAQVSGQLSGRFRMVTFDNRGHGMSEKPLDPGCYTDRRLWADDLASVIEQTGLERPVVVAWSYGGFIVGDYLHAHGDSGIGGIDLVGAAVLLKPPTFDHLGPGLLENAQDACVADLRVNIEAMQRFLRACTAEQLDAKSWATALCWNMIVPREVRAALIGREVDDSEVFARLTVPVLVTHGRQDAVVLPSMADHTLRCCEGATASWYEGVGHMPFIEDAERFNRELEAFADRARS